MCLSSFGPKPVKLANQYGLLRHGESIANVLGIVTSDPAVATIRYGLTPHGAEQVRQSASAYRDRLAGSHVRLISSDLLRARQTAEIARRVLGAPAVANCIGLRERRFGDWEGQPGDSFGEYFYEQEEAHVETAGVETTHAVFRRMLGVVAAAEQCYRDKLVILTSHGDPLQILQTAFSQPETLSHPMDYRNWPMPQNGVLNIVGNVITAEAAQVAGITGGSAPDTVA